MWVVTSRAAITTPKSTDLDDGSMNQKERQKVIEKIKNDKNTRIILMSFKAGGVGRLSSLGLLRCSHIVTPGLNLTACNNVILVDLWWNPALEVRRAISPALFHKAELLSPFRTRRLEGPTELGKRSRSTYGS